MATTGHITQLCGELVTALAAVTGLVGRLVAAIAATTLDEQRPAHRPRVNDARNAVMYYLRVVEGLSTAEIRDAIYAFESHFENITPLPVQPLNPDKRSASATVRGQLREMNVEVQERED